MGEPDRPAAPNAPVPVRISRSLWPRVRRGTLDLKLWQRLHVRVTALYGVVVLLALAVLSAVTYRGGVDIAMTGLRTRLGGTVVAIARGLSPQDIEALRGEGPHHGPRYQEMLADVGAIDAANKDLLSIYLLLPTEPAGTFTFGFDFVAPGKRHVPAAEFGKAYDGRSNATLLRGLREVSVETEIASDAWGDSLSAFAPVLDAQGKPVAVVGIDADANEIRRMKLKVMALAGLLSLAATIVLGVAGFFVGKSIRKPVISVIDAATAIGAGNFETRLRLQRHDEFGILGEHFDQMAAGLEERNRIRSAFGRYVSEDVAKRVLSSSEGARMGGEVREVTVLFCDLRGYSTISEMLSPTEIVEFLNEYLEVMNAEIDKAGGIIIEFLGDAILSVFNAPNDLEAHPERAVRCAMAMRQGLAAFNERMDAEGRAPWTAKGMPRLAQRIGIHTGQVVAGNLGSKVRTKYAVIGDAVNVASRCEGLNKVLGTEILCTLATWERLPSELQAQLEDKGAHEVKGRTKKVAVYSA
jgi:class 3 adenylate cyclase